MVVGSVIAAAVLTPSTDRLTQMLLAGSLMDLYLGGAWIVKALCREMVCFMVTVSHLPEII